MLVPQPVTTTSAVVLGLVDGVAADGIVVVTATGDIVVGRYDMGFADGNDVGAFDEVVGEDEALGPLVGKTLGPLVGVDVFEGFEVGETVVGDVEGGWTV